MLVLASMANKGLLANSTHVYKHNRHKCDDYIFKTLQKNNVSSVNILMSLSPISDSISGWENICKH